jgi:predicted metalloprotease with PDZ domain
VCSWIVLPGERQSLKKEHYTFSYAKARACRNLVVAVGRVVVLACLTSVVSAQQTKVEIKVLAESPGRVIVEGSSAAATAWSFRDSYAGVMNLGTRIQAFRLFDGAGAEVVTRAIGPGQFRAQAPATKFRYEVDLTPPLRSTDAARVSWLNSERGLLMLRDLLPGRGSTDQSAGRVTVRLNLPQGWLAHTNESENVREEFEIADADVAVFAVGQNLRISTSSVSGLNLSFVAAGDWAFRDSEALELAGKVLKAHREMFGSSPTRRATLILFPFPQSAAADNWSAETRGFSVALLTGKLPSKVAALAQLSAPLTHEFFHFWVPNGLNLVGDYDWFYEGFTVYQAAQVAVRLGLLTFPEFLNAISRAYDGYALSLDRDRWSLVEASRRRFTVGSSAVYSKSMLVAFLYDLSLRSLSRNKRSLDDVYHNILRDYGYQETRARAGSSQGEGSDGSEAVLKSLNAFSGMQEFGGSLIAKPASINLAERLAPFGLRVETFGLRTRISVGDSLTRQQRDLLHDLGYNDYVRSPRQKK